MRNGLRTWGTLLVLVWLVASALPAAAQGLVKDINTGVNLNFPPSSASISVSQNTLYFAGCEIAEGCELWKSDGTAAGTALVRDINPGPGSGMSGPAASVDGGVVFGAWNAEHGGELWRSDGTAAGTELVKDLVPGPAGSSPRSFVRVDGSLWFTASSESGYGIWKTDGTAAGTVLVSPFNGQGGPGSLTDVGGIAFFIGRTATGGYDLWRSDGTAAGTQIVTHLDPVPAASEPSNLINVGGVLFFTAGGLWRSDGTAAGTFVINSAPAEHLIAVGSRLFFTASNGTTHTLWVSDGSAAGTRPVYDGVWGELAAVGTTVFFSGDPAVAAGLWKSDGTTAGTVLVKAGADSSAVPARSFVDVQGTLFFAGSDGSGPYTQGLWKSDGTPDGTVLVRSFVGGAPPETTYPDELHDFNGVLVFTAGDGFGGRVLWRSDGTAAGTIALTQYTSSSSLLLGPSRYQLFPTQPVDVNGTLFFTAYDTVAGDELWKSDGTEAGTIRARDIAAGAPGSDPHNLARVKDTLFFVVDSNDLWKTDGTAAGTTPVTPWLSVQSIVALGGRALVAGVETGFGAHAQGIWSSDGTESGTTRLAVLGEIPHDLTRVNGTVFFVASGDLWKTDGTVSGTAVVKASDASFSVGRRIYDPVGHSLVAAGGTLFFFAWDALYGMELWKSDGTAAGTVLVADVNPGSADAIPRGNPSSSTPWPFVAVNGRVYFGADDGVHGTELWTSDGTAAGTVLVRDIAPGSDSSMPSLLTNHYGTLYFSAAAPDTGQELWRSDGTEDGTRLVHDGRPGPNGHVLTITSSASGLFFSPQDPNVGYEPWLAPPEVSIRDQAWVEGNTGTSLFHFFVSLATRSPDVVTVAFQTEDRTAHAGTDYTATSGLLTFLPGQTSRTVLVPVNGNTMPDPDKTFAVRLSQPVNAVLGREIALGTVVNDDPPAPAPLIDVYRLFASGLTGEHLYTTDSHEYNVLGAGYNPATQIGWLREGVAFKMLENAGTYQGVYGIPLYRMYCAPSAQHHWTTDPHEVQVLNGYQEFTAEGIVGYMVPDPPVGAATPLYRLEHSPLHLWTIEAHEKDVLTGSGWNLEGTSGNAIP